MLSRLASYLLGGAGEDAATAEEVASGCNSGSSNNANKENEAGAAAAASMPVEARLRQVEVEGDDWILIDRNVEGFTGMDESWYVTPPACFTQPSPVHVETSPLEDLLIEHPSMSVYRSAGKKTHLHHHHHSDKKSQQDKAARTRPSKRRSLPLSNVQLQPVQVVNANTTQSSTTAARPQPSSTTNAVVKKSNKSERAELRAQQQQQQQQQQQLLEQPARRASVRDLRNARADDSVRIVQIRSAQKMLEKRTGQSAKRNRLERGNKVREVGSSGGKGRRPRRQDRLRLNNSGANNNRKC